MGTEYVGNIYRRRDRKKMAILAFFPINLSESYKNHLYKKSLKEFSTSVIPFIFVFVLSFLRSLKTSRQANQFSS